MKKKPAKKPAPRGKAKVAPATHPAPSEELPAGKVIRLTNELVDALNALPENDRVFGCTHPFDKLLEWVWKSEGGPPRKGWQVDALWFMAANSTGNLEMIANLPDSNQLKQRLVQQVETEDFLPCIVGLKNGKNMVSPKTALLRDRHLGRRLPIDNSRGTSQVDGFIYRLANLAVNALALGGIEILGSKECRLDVLFLKSISHEDTDGKLRWQICPASDSMGIPLKADWNRWSPELRRVFTYAIATKEEKTRLWLKQVLPFTFPERIEETKKGGRTAVRIFSELSEKSARAERRDPKNKELVNPYWLFRIIKDQCPLSDPISYEGSQKEVLRRLMSAAISRFR